MKTKFMLPMIEVKNIWNLDHKVSSIFSLEKQEGMRLNFTDECYLYQSAGESLILAELLTMRSDQVLELKVNKWECFGLT